jgi:peroxidase
MRKHLKLSVELLESRVLMAADLALGSTDPDVLQSTLASTTGDGLSTSSGEDLSSAAATSNVVSSSTGSSASVTPAPTSLTGVVGSQGVEPINGVGNNIAHPTLGAANTDFARLTAANFADGIDAPNGPNLPSARAISNLIANQDLNGTEQDLDNNRAMSDWVYAWGQFIDHDIDLTESGDVPMNIPVPAGDPTFDPTNQGNLSIAFDRSQTAPGTGTSTSNPAQFVNQDTSFIDGSMIYGSDATTAAALRTFTGGQLKTSAGNLLPYNTMGLNMADNIGVPENTLFAAGDVRANENVELSNITTLFVREHNYQANLLAKQHPTWTDQQLYNGARQIVIGEIQSITYNEYLPAMMGNNALTTYRGYNANVNPSIDVEFASAAFRLHTLLDDDVEFLNNNGTPSTTLPELPLASDFFQPAIVAQPGEVAANLKYLSTDLSQEVDEQTVDGLRNALFPDAPVINNVEVGASDLIADDIQRGRDEGDPTYNQARIAVGERPVTSFAQITSNVQLQQELRQIYGNVNNVELFVGLMAENHLPGSSLGQTEQAILAKQFEGLRDGDRFFYENADPSSLVNQLNNTTLAQVIERNTTLTNLQPNVFQFYSNIQGTVVGTPAPTTHPSFGGTNGANGRNPSSPLAGVTVELLYNGQVIDTTTTNARGVYQFQQVGAGSFTVQVVAPSESTISNAASLSAKVNITKGQDGPSDPAVANFWMNGVVASPSTGPVGLHHGNPHTVLTNLIGAQPVVSLSTDGGATNSGLTPTVDGAGGVTNSVTGAVGLSALAVGTTSPRLSSAVAAVDQVFASQNIIDSLRDTSF